jgi:hypothetical protein
MNTRRILLEVWRYVPNLFFFGLELDIRLIGGLFIIEVWLRYWSVHSGSPSLVASQCHCCHGIGE